MLGLIVAAVVKIAIMIGFAVNLSAILTWMERRQSALMQDRIGPVRANIGRVRLWGLLHPVADALKLLNKEDFIPPKVHRTVYLLAPLFALVPVLLAFAVIPFGPPVCLDKLAVPVADLAQCQQVEYLQIAHIDIGILFIFAVASLGVYGAALAGWASFNNFALLGGLRASAQMISYEVTMGMAMMGAFLVFGTLEPMAMVQKQDTLAHWGIVQQPLGFILFFFAAIAETKRAPFDLPEGESEIVGYFVEYGGVRFMTFFLGEFLEIVFVGAIVTTVFLGGWQIPGLQDGAFAHWIVVLLRVAAFMAKVFVVCFIQLAIRWTLPRMRYDQLMRLGWKGMLPASIANVVITAALVMWSQPGLPR
ncbi:MAG: NADH-quinone oxidoreductase subunit H [Deltaproteobacteria bacterium]|nr:NADH-quinone oxidoreductase subunit H [Deltaproteobacteria bacterium]